MFKYICIIFVLLFNISLESKEKYFQYLNSDKTQYDLLINSENNGISDNKERDEALDFFDPNHFILQYLYKNQLFGINSILKHSHELFPDIEIESCINLNDWLEDWEELTQYGFNESDVLNLSISQIKEKFQKIKDKDKRSEYLLDLFKIYSSKNKNEEIEQLLELLTNENDEFQIMEAKVWIHRNLEKMYYNKDTLKRISNEIQWSFSRIKFDYIQYLENSGFFDHEDLHEKNYKDQALAILVDLYCNQEQIAKAESTLSIIKSLDERLKAYKSLMKIYAKIKTPEEILDFHEKNFMRGKIDEKPISNLYWLSSHDVGEISYPEIVEYFLESFLRNHSMDGLKIYLKDIEEHMIDYDKIGDFQYSISESCEDKLVGFAIDLKYLLDNDFEKLLAEEYCNIEDKVINKSFKLKKWEIFDKLILFDDNSNFCFSQDLIKYHERLLPLITDFLNSKTDDEIKSFFELYKEHKSLDLLELVFLCMAKNKDL